MSRIEEFKRARDIADRVQREVQSSLGLNAKGLRDHRNDKRCARCRFVALASDPFSPMLLSVDCHYGYYGSSSAYSATSRDLGEFLAAAVSTAMPSLLREAALLARAEAEQARANAASEASSVLDQTAWPPPPTP